MVIPSKKHPLECFFHISTPFSTVLDTCDLIPAYPRSGPLSIEELPSVRQILPQVLSIHRWMISPIYLRHTRVLRIDPTAQNGTIRLIMYKITFTPNDSNHARGIIEYSLHYLPDAVAVIKPESSARSALICAVSRSTSA